jgi:uncharacterized integral membrane protein
MRTMKLILLLILAVILTLLVAQNTAPVQMRFLWMIGEVPAVLLLFLTAAGGFILGLLAALLVKTGRKDQMNKEM